MPARISNVLSTILSTRLRHVSEFKGITANERILKSGSITINGIKLWISANDTLKTLTEKINAKSHLTKVKAELINTLAGAKLLLRPEENQRLNLIDLDSIFVKAYLRGKFSNDKSIILQVIQDSSQNSNKRNHHKNTKVQLPNNTQLLSEFIKFALASYDTNNPVTRATPAPVIIEPADPIMEAIEAPAEPVGHQPSLEIVAHIEPASQPVTAALENFTAANEPEAPVESTDQFVATTAIKSVIEPANLSMTSINEKVVDFVLGIYEKGLSQSRLESLINPVVKGHNKKLECILELCREDAWKNKLPQEVLSDLIITVATNRVGGSINANTRTMEKLVKQLNSSSTSGEIKRHFIQLLEINHNQTNLAEFKSERKAFTEFVQQNKGQKRIHSKAVLLIALNKQAQDLNKLIDINELKPQDDENKNRQEIKFVAKDIIKNAIFKAMKKATTTKIHPDLNQYITDQLCEALDKKYKDGRSKQDGKQIEYTVYRELYNAFAKPDNEHKTEAYVLPSKKEFKLQDREKTISDIIDWIKKFAF